MSAVVLVDLHKWMLVVLTKEHLAMIKQYYSILSTNKLATHWLLSLSVSTCLLAQTLIELSLAYHL